MKLTIELNDADLHRAIESQVSKLIADTTTDIIKEKIDAILAVKFGRLDGKSVEAAIAAAADKAISAVTSKHYSATGVVNNALAAAAEKILKEKLR